MTKVSPSTVRVNLNTVKQNVRLQGKIHPVKNSITGKAGDYSGRLASCLMYENHIIGKLGGYR